MDNMVQLFLDVFIFVCEYFSVCMLLYMSKPAAHKVQRRIQDLLKLNGY